MLDTLPETHPDQDASFRGIVPVETVEGEDTPFITGLMLLVGLRPSLLRPPAGWVRLDQDINATTGGPYIFMCYTKQASAGRPIRRISVGSGRRGERVPVNLNTGTFSDSQYLFLGRTPEGEVSDGAITDIDLVSGWFNVYPPAGWELIPGDLNQSAGITIVQIVCRRLTERQRMEEAAAAAAESAGVTTEATAAVAAAAAAGEGGGASGDAAIPILLDSPRDEKPMTEGEASDYVRLEDGRIELTGCSKDRLLRLLAFLSEHYKHQGLHTMRRTTTELKPRQLVALGDACRALELLCLDLSLCSLPYASSLTTLLNHCSTLSRLELPHCSLPQRGFAALRRRPAESLKSIDLSGSCLTELAVQALNDWLCSTALAHHGKMQLILDGCEISDEALIGLAAGSSFRCDELHASFAYLPCSPESIGKLMTNLTTSRGRPRETRLHLSLAHSQLPILSALPDAACLYSLAWRGCAPLSQLTAACSFAWEVTHMDLSFTPVTLFKSPGANLKTLLLNHTAIQGGAATLLMFVESTLDKLERLELDSSGIDDHIVPAIPRLRASALTHLSLRHNHITTAAVLRLLRTMSTDGMRPAFTVDLTGNPIVWPPSAAQPDWLLGDFPEGDVLEDAEAAGMHSFEEAKHAGKEEEEEEGVIVGVVMDAAGGEEAVPAVPAMPAMPAVPAARATDAGRASFDTMAAALGFDDDDDDGYGAAIGEGHDRFREDEVDESGKVMEVRVMYDPADDEDNELPPPRAATAELDAVLADATDDDSDDDLDAEQQQA
eukprot:PLAT10729.4.p1 GENE.PLAT10729.4~~PLAT10729.4.p1  ORF type:complete len:887 (+),score=121.67 PLAT10729.4:327-2663(+)